MRYLRRIVIVLIQVFKDLELYAWQSDKPWAIVKKGVRNILTNKEVEYVIASYGGFIKQYIGTTSLIRGTVVPKDNPEFVIVKGKHTWNKRQEFQLYRLEKGTMTNQIREFYWCRKDIRDVFGYVPAAIYIKILEENPLEKS